jgi:hypothetical protein
VADKTGGDSKNWEWNDHQRNLAGKPSVESQTSFKKWLSNKLISLSVGTVGKLS